MASTGTVRRSARLGGLAGLSVLLYSMSGITKDRLFVLASAVVGACWVASLVLQPRLTGLRYRREAPERAVAGGTVTVTYEFSNPTRRRLGSFSGLEGGPGLGPVRIAVPSLGPGEHGSVAIEVPVGARGRYDVRMVGFTASGAFGFFRAFMGQRLHTPLTVHPAPAPPVSLRLTAGHDEPDGTPAPRPGHGLELHGLRQWRPGDPARSVHWRRSARVGELLVREAAAETARNVTLVLGPPGSGPAWEWAVAQAAATARRALAAGAEVRVRTGAGEVTSGSVVELLDLCATLEAGGGVLDPTAGDGAVLWLAATPPPASLSPRLAASLVPVEDGRSAA